MKTTNQLKHSMMLPILIGLMVSLASISTDLYVPALPQMQLALHSPSSLIKLSVVAFILGMSLMQLVYGTLSDIYGRKPMVTIGLIIATIGGAITVVFNQSIYTILAGRLLQGIGLAGVMAIFRGIVRDVYSGKQLAVFIGYFALILGFVPAIAPLAGSYLTYDLGWHSNFIFIFTYTSLVCLLVMLFLPETKPNLAIPRTNIKQNLLELLNHPPFIGYMLSSGLSLACIFSFATLAPFLLQNIFGFSVLQYGYATLGISAGIILGRIINACIIKSLQSNNIIRIGLSIMIIGCIFMITSHLWNINQPMSLIVGSFIIICGTGLIFPSCAVAALTPFKHISGAAGALYGCTQMLTASIASFIVAYIPQHNNWVLCNTFIIITILCLCCQLLINYNTKSQKDLNIF